MENFELDRQTDILRSLPEPLQPLLSLLLATKEQDLKNCLLQFVAAFSHPDMVCNLADIQNMPQPVKTALVQFFLYCLNYGLTMKEQAHVDLFIQPFFTQPGG